MSKGIPGLRRALALQQRDGGGRTAFVPLRRSRQQLADAPFAQFEHGLPQACSGLVGGVCSCVGVEGGADGATNVRCVGLDRVGNVAGCIDRGEQQRFVNERQSLCGAARATAFSRLENLSAGGAAPSSRWQQWRDRAQPGWDVCRRTAENRGRECRTWARSDRQRSVAGG